MRILSTAPSLFAPTIAGLQAAGLTSTNVRMALEKPLGNDLQSSHEINDAAAAAFAEAQTFRIDHYLGKETVQNLLALRFANLLFEPLWNSAHIDHVQITIAETVGLEGRGDYYEAAGACATWSRTHAAIARAGGDGAAVHFDATAVRDEKVKVLRSCDRSAPRKSPHSVIGHMAGASTASRCQGIARTRPRQQHRDVRRDQGASDNWRGRGPFLPSHRQHLPERQTRFLSIDRVPHSIFAADGATAQANKLVIGLQPEETIRLW